MKIAVASDLHGLWDELFFPPADILIIAGDIFGYYSRDKLLNAQTQLIELEKFDEFLGKIKYKFKDIICVAGNHDFAFEKYLSKAKKLLTNAIYLQDESYMFNGYKLYGSPWQTYFGGWAFNFPDHHANFFKARAHARKCWESIPEDTNILITHCPPLNILDETAAGEAVGCQWLKEQIETGLPSLILHVFGHIHAARGWSEQNGILHVNASVCYNHDKLSWPPYLIEIDDDIAKISSGNL